MTKVAVGHNAPDFSLVDTNGLRCSLASALKRGPAVVAFMKVSCPVCQFTLPFLERLHEAYGNDGVSFLGVSQDDERDTHEFWQEYDLTFTALVDAEGYPASNAYGLTTVPTILMVAPDGKVQVSGTGFVKKDLEKISAEIARRLGVPAAAVFRPGESIPDYKPG
jgi:peroxiredoxin